MLPLEGITVVSLEQAVAAPFATRQLADLGARVIKVERPGTGDFARGYDETVNGLSSHFVWLNRSKESLTLNLKEEAARDVLERLLSGTDVFVQNLAPGATERLGFGADRLRADYPRIVVCGISGYGSGGPYTNKKAYDLLVQCESGLLAITGTPDTPSKVGISIADIAAGMYAYCGVLTALLARERTGQGAAFEVSMLEALGEWMGFPAYFTHYGGSQPPRTGARHSAIAPYGPFTCGDGVTAFIGVQNDREWSKFCQDVLNRPELAGDARFGSNSKRVRAGDALNDIIEGVFGTLASDEVIAKLDESGIANARMRDVEEFVDHPQLEARARWREVGSPAGPLRALIPPVTIPGTDPVMGSVPEVSQHTESILAELEFDSEEIAALRLAGAV